MIECPICKRDMIEVGNNEIQCVNCGFCSDDLEWSGKGC